MLWASEGRGNDTGGGERLIAEAHGLAQDLRMKRLVARCQLWRGMRAPSEPRSDTAMHLAAAGRALNELGMEHWARIAERGATDR
jgi:hypothetical protein